MTAHQYDRTPNETALVFASWARTALDDPGAIADEDLPQTGHRFEGVTPAHIMYAIDRVDDLFEALDPALETRENLSRALTEAGRVVASIVETIGLCADDPGEDGEAYGDAHDAAQRALDTLDEAISMLRPNEEAS